MDLRNWIGQSTTGAGFATILATLGAVASGALTLQHAVPVLIGGVIGLIWPENSALKMSAQQVALAVEGAVGAYQASKARPAAQAPAKPAGA